MHVRLVLQIFRFCSRQKSTHIRTKDFIQTKFGNKSRLTDFEADVWKNLEKYEDTIAYLLDLKDTTEALCTVTKHIQFLGNMNNAIKQEEIIFCKFDIWEKTHMLKQEAS